MDSRGKPVSGTLWTIARADAESAWRFGSRIRMLRQRRGLSLDRLSDLAEIGEGIMVAIEGGMCHVEIYQITALARSLDTTPEVLMEGLGEPTPIDQQMSIVLTTMHQVPDESEWSAEGLEAKSRLSSGVLYPTVAKLEQAGFLQSRLEGDAWPPLHSPGNADDVSTAATRGPEGRPRLYRLTRLGVELKDYRVTGPQSTE